MVDFKYADLFENDSIDKQFFIKTDDGLVNITNEELHQEQFELVEGLCSESELRFGCFEAGSVKFKISNVFISLKDKWITVGMTIGGKTDEVFNFGRYKVFSDKPTANRKYREIVAYDALYEIINSDVTEWYNTILQKDSSETTLKKFRNSFFNHFGIKQEDAELVNDEMNISKTINVVESSESSSETEETSIIGESISGMEVLSCICEINGCFGRMGRNGKFQYVYLEQNIQGLYPADDLYPANNLYPREPKTKKIGKELSVSAEYESFLVKTIDKLQIRETKDDIGVIYGNGNNVYVIEDNFLVYGKGSEELKNIAKKIYSKIEGIVYRPFSLECKGNPCLEVGDAIRFSTKYELVESYILNRTLKGIQALKDTYEASGEEYRTENVNGLHRSILQLKGKSNVLERDIEKTRSEIKDVENGLNSTITQTASQIRMEVKNVKEGLESSITQTASQIRMEVKNVKEGLESSITQTASEIKTEVSANYETKTNAAATKKTLESSITQTASEIKTKVSKGDVSSTISQESDKITITGERFKLKTTNLTIDTDGAIVSKSIDIMNSYTEGSDGYATSGFKVQKDGTTKINFLSVGSGGIASKAKISSLGTVEGVTVMAGSGGFATTGTKARVVDTYFGEKSLYCYEMPSPVFGDIGRGKTDEYGECMVFIDGVFAETINTLNCEYNVFLTPYGKGIFYVEQREASYFVVKGETMMDFAWEIKAKQKDYEYTRLETFEIPEENKDLLQESADYIQEVILL